MQQTPDSPSEKSEGKPALPEPKNEYTMPEKRRMPLHGKVEPPSVQGKSARERLALMEENKKKKKRKGFLFGLWAGQLMILALSLGGERVLAFFPNHDVELPFRLVVFAGIAASLLLVGMLIDLLLFFQALGCLFSPKGKKFGRALWNGIRRVARASFAWGATVLVFCGTSAATIPMEQWKPSVERMKVEGEKLFEQIKEGVSASPPPGASPRS